MIGGAVWYDAQNKEFHVYIYWDLRAKLFICKDSDILPMIIIIHAFCSYNNHTYKHNYVDDRWYAPAILVIY